MNERRTVGTATPTQSPRPSSYDSLKIAIAGGDTARPLNLAKRVALIARAIPLAGARVLDAGCGAGEYVAALGDRGARVIGIEHEDEKVRAWNERHPDDPRVRQGNLEALNLASESFDVALLNEVLEHVPDEMAALRELHRVLRPGGTLLIFSPNRLYPFETHGVDSQRTGARIAPLLTFGYPWLPLGLTRRWVRPWARNYWPHELSQLVREAGFDVRRRYYVWQTFENISGRQPRAIALIRPGLRRLATMAERLPGLRAFGTSQLLIARKPPT